MSHSAVPAPVTAALPHLVPPPAGHCLNCHQRLAGPFCHHCGQAASAPARITRRWLLHDLPHSIWHVDHGIIYTVREMLLRPGNTIRRYLAGERQVFFRPLSLLLLVGGIGAFLFGKFHIVLFDTHQAGVSLRVQNVQQQMLHIIQKYQTWISILFLPIAASIATPLLRRTTGYSWAEQLVTAALLSGAFSAVSLLFIPALAYWSGQQGVGYVAFAMATSMICYKAWGYAQLQAVTAGPAYAFRRWLRGLLVAVGEYLCISILIGIVIFALVLLKP